MDPLGASGRTGDSQSWNRYVYGLNNPLRFIDPSGMLAGDYYGQDGTFIGSDGVEDGRFYLITDSKAVKAAKNAVKRTGKVEPLADAAYFELPAATVRDAIGAALQRSNSPFGDDRQGGFHEEGGLLGSDASGRPMALSANPGPFALPPATATFNPFAGVDAGRFSSISGSFHIHPAGTVAPLTTGMAFSNIERRLGFEQAPGAGDMRWAARYSGLLNVVVGAGNNTVNFYGARTGHMPLGVFLGLGK